MATPANAKPRPVVAHLHQDEPRVRIVLFFAVVASVLINGLLLVAMAILFPLTASAGPETELEASRAEDALKLEAPEKPKEANDPFTTTDIDPARQEFDTDIQYKNERLAEYSVPGLPDAAERVGILNAPKDNPPTNLPAPGGLGSIGQGGALDNAAGSLTNIGTAGGYGPRGMPLAGSFYGRSGSTREYALRDGGGTGESEAAVTRGLRWLVRTQLPDGSWELEGNHRDNKIAATAFGLLPLLGSGHTHKPAKNNPYDKPIEKALLFLIRKQDKKTGNFGGGMYAHGLATIAISEAYGLSQDPNLRRPAQLAVNFIVSAQHRPNGGWRYSPGQAGDLSVVGWQVMALKSAQMAGLDVPQMTMNGAQRFLDEVCDTGAEGYKYTAGNAATHTLTAVGLLCRQYLQSWGSKNVRMINGTDNWIKKNPPGDQKNMYYYYYATQVMHHFGGQAWKDWNDKMRDHLIKTQDKSNGPNGGSWDARGEYHTAGRLMQTSLCLLTLEVYYRHLPLYYKDSGERMANQN